MADYPWRRLGELLVERGLIDRYDLEYALKEQRLSGSLLGELLVARGLISPDALAAAIAAQHGLAMGKQDAAPSLRLLPPPGEARPFRPLGRVLVDRDALSESGLQRVLAEQRRHGGMLGEILVRRGYVSASDLAAALAEQHGLEVDPDLLERAEPAASSAMAEERRYEVRTADSTSPLHVSGSFLDATDFAFELLDSDDPETLEIVRMDGPGPEVVWSYSREAAESARGPAA